MLSKDQCPVDISKTGVTLLNNLLGMIPLLVVVLIKSEYSEIPTAVNSLDSWGVAWVAASCLVGVGISYTGLDMWTLVDIRVADARVADARVADAKASDA